MQECLKRLIQSIGFAGPFLWPEWLKHSLRTTGIALLIVLSLTTALLCFALDNSPQPIIPQGLNRDDIDRAKQLLHISPEEKNHVKTLRLNAKDLTIAISYLLNHFVENTTAAALTDDRLNFQIAIFVPPNPFGRYLDFSFSIRQGENHLYIKSFKIGEISIPDPAANWLIPFIVHHSMLEQYWQLANHYVQNVQIHDQTLQISYLSSIVEEAKQLAINKHKDYPSLHLYQQLINETVLKHDPEWRLSLTELLKPVFQLAKERSTPETTVQENRTAIIAVASYVFKGELRHYLPIGLVYNREYPVFAYKRIDVPQHFIASALLSATNNGLLSKQIGLDKEVGDSQKGSGFSFIDINSDKAGDLFGQMATRNAESAGKLQQFMAQIKDYTAIIPDPTGLPEKMDEFTFKEQFTEVGSPAYRALVDQIDQHISELPIQIATH